MAVVIDSQTVRAAETVGRSSRGYDAAKKANGRKRSVAVDFVGMLLAALVTSAGVQDRDIARELLVRLVGATAFTHSTGYFVTFMTGNTERAVLGFFRDESWLVLAAAMILASFVGGVVIASLCRRYLWVAHPHGPTVLTTLCLLVATAADTAVRGWSGQLTFVPIMFVTFGVGALNTSFVENGEVSIPLSYVTGTLVKMGQGIERHISGGDVTAWLGYFVLYASFIAGATAGGCISLVVSGSQMLAVATAVCALTTGYTYFHTDRRRAVAMSKQNGNDAVVNPCRRADVKPQRPVH